MMKRTIIFLTVCLSAAWAQAQDFNVPENYKLEKAEDYAPYEDDVIACFDWLMQTPIDEEAGKRKEANAFLLKWVMGSPTVSIGIDGEIVSFADNGELLLIFIGGWTKYALQNKDEVNALSGNLAGIEAVLAFYKANRLQLGKIKAVEKYQKLKEKGELEQHLSNKLS